MPTGLPPVVDDRTRVLVLGSMPGEVSLAKQQYYAHPRNAFWPIMGDLIGLDATASYRLRVQALLSAGVGLWDVLRYCERPGSLDSSIAREAMEVNDFDGLLHGQPGISRAFFNGATAWQVFQRLVAPVLTTPLDCTRLPSTSPAHAAMPYSAKLAAWRVVVEVG